MQAFCAEPAKDSQDTGRPELLWYYPWCSQFLQRKTSPVSCREGRAVTAKEKSGCGQDPEYCWTLSSDLGLSWYWQGSSVSSPFFSLSLYCLF